MDRQSYTVYSQNDEGSRDIDTPQDKGKLMRNIRPCGRCSKSQRKCDVEPPYSSALCRQCAKAGLAECPPYEPRKKASVDDRASQSSLTPQDSMSSHDGGIHDGPVLQHSRQHSGVDTDTVFLMHPTQITQAPAAPLTTYTPAYPVPPPSAGYTRPISSLYVWGSQTGWKESAPTAPSLMSTGYVPLSTQRLPMSLDEQWGESPAGVNNASTIYQTPPAHYGMPYP